MKAVWMKKIGRIAVRAITVFTVTIVLLFCGLWCAAWTLVNGPSPTVGRLFVLSLKETSAAGFIADWFVSDEELEALYASAAVEEKTDIDSTLINIPNSDLSLDTSVEGDDGTVSDKDPTQGIEIQDISGPTYNGKMMLISDPKRVFVGVPDKYGAGCRGLTLTQMIEKYGCIGGTNAGGFEDIGGAGTGGVPDGIVISDGKLLWGGMNTYYSLAGLDENGLLYVGKMTSARALELGIKYAASYGPALIINGEPCNAKRSLGGGVNPRTAIGQRADGTILLLVVNGRQLDSLGATLDDLVEIMLSYGAVNASNLDGGSSSLMVYNGEYMNTSSYVYGGERALPTTILVK